MMAIRTNTAGQINFIVHESNCVNVCSCSGCNGGPDWQVNIDEANLQITSNGTALAAGACAHIRNTPAMPTIVTSMVAPSYPGTLPDNVTWNLQVNYTGPDSPPTTYSYGVPDTSVAASSPFTIPWNNTYIGGQATLTYTYLSTLPQTFQFCIDGLNASQDTVKTQLGTSPWFIRDIAYDESKYYQFNASHNPLFGAPHGFGIMQLDPPKSQLDVFKWTRNVYDGVVYVNSLSQGALDQWNSYVDNYTTWAAAHNNTPPPPADDPEGTSCVFSYTPSAGQYPFSDAIWIKKYNSPRYPYIEWDNTNDVWVFHKCASSPLGPICYVNRICSQNQ